MIDLHDYAGLEPGDVKAAQVAAGLSFQREGIDIQWRYCPLPCKQGPNDPTHLTVVVLPEDMAKKMATGPQQFGMAIGGEAGGFGTRAYIYRDRVRNQAEVGKVPGGLLLGTMIAHEVGHLLLGDNSHFPVGIMRAKWRPNDMKLALMGAMHFTRDQAEQIRQDVDRRSKGRGGNQNE